VRLTLSFAVIALVVAGCAPASSRQTPTGATTFEAEARAIDGDTVAVSFRLLGVDAFEKRQMCLRDGGCWPCGKIAQDVAAKALRDETARITLTPGRTHGRPVAVLEVAGADLGESMIHDGLAIPAVKYLSRDQPRAQRYEAAFAAARHARAGAHAGQWVDPADWRRGKRLACEADLNR
jgi:micrococcal nuclease